MSAQCVRTASVSVSEMGDTDTQVYFIKPVAATPRSEPSELQNVNKICA